MISWSCYPDSCETITTITKANEARYQNNSERTMRDHTSYARLTEEVHALRNEIANMHRIITSIPDYLDKMTTMIHANPDMAMNATSMVSSAIRTAINETSFRTGAVSREGMPGQP